MKIDESSILSIKVDSKQSIFFVTSRGELKVLKKGERYTKNIFHDVNCELLEKSFIICKDNLFFQSKKYLLFQVKISSNNVISLQKLQVCKDFGKISEFKKTHKQEKLIVLTRKGSLQVINFTALSSSIHRLNQKQSKLFIKKMIIFFGLLITMLEETKLSSAVHTRINLETTNLCVLLMVMN
ncbi:MAG: hypothetical protein P0S93_06780 [Candidatus Neptunochlamydia sp.]|nr:hypothetical protein [Candidatus Neptunochlamydia sp.]